MIKVASNKNSRFEASRRLMADDFGVIINLKLLGPKNKMLTDTYIYENYSKNFDVTVLVGLQVRDCCPLWYLFFIQTCNI